MNISIRYDGVPYRVLFSGTVDISARKLGVAISGASEDFKLWGVAVDASTQQRLLEEEQERRDVVRVIEDRLHQWWRTPQSSCGGSKVRAGYD